MALMMKNENTVKVWYIEFLSFIGKQKKGLVKKDIQKSSNKSNLTDYKLNTEEEAKVSKLEESKFKHFICLLIYLFLIQVKIQ